MITRRWSYVLIGIMTILALALRVWWLDRAPKGALIDEAHYGYIAYSLLETGKDEHGSMYPIVFKGFGDQKLPVYAYALVPIIKWLGLTTTAVRLPSVVAGALLVPVMFWLLRTVGASRSQAVFGSVLAAFSPWTFILSRFAYESNVALLFFTLGLLFLIKAVRQQASSWLIVSALMWALTWYSYVAYRPITAALAVMFLAYAVVKRHLSLRKVSLFFVIFGMLIAPLFHPAIAHTGSARLKQVGIFDSEGIAMEVNDNRTYCGMQLPSVICYGLWNKVTVIGRVLGERMLYVYSPEFMATRGEAQLRYASVEGFGQLYSIVYPLLLLGLIALVFHVEDNEVSDIVRWMVLLGLLITPVPAILAGEPQKIRFSAAVPFVITACVYGWKLLQELVPHQVVRKLIVGGFILAFVGSVATFMVSFFTVHVVKYDLVYQSYLPDVFAKTESLRDPNTKVFIKPFFSDPIMAYAFYAKVNPGHYQAQVKLGEVEPSGFQHAIELDNYIVSEDPMVNIGCKANSEGYKALYLTNEEFKPVDKLAAFGSVTGAVNYAYLYDASEYATENSTQCL